MLDYSQPTSVASPTSMLDELQALDSALQHHFKGKLILQPALKRSLVSFQANKTRPRYRWYKYKEAFSAALVEYLLQQYQIGTGHLLDPFTGSGTALFAASAAGINADGIELLPIGQEIVATRRLIEADFTAADFQSLSRWAKDCVWQHDDLHTSLPVLRITNGAYPPETHAAIEQFMAASERENERVQAVLRFALLCVLESVSYTRKDGQYLRWDYRSSRRQGQKPFNKGRILGFEEAITTKIDEILSDVDKQYSILDLFPTHDAPGHIRLYQGSCLEIMPQLSGQSYDVIVTSPPYCNRYDYTRTYALELALLGVDEQQLVALRQHMLSCTVENRAKDLLSINPVWTDAVATTDQHRLLQTILSYLEDQKNQGTLNNNGIPRMVRGYFYEMACIIAECARVLKPGAPLIMVNDNVRYAGASISVDLILSSIAESLGFDVEHILVLPNDKGNSSQQMGEHGRASLRKCVYVWRKAA
jgi:DNA modification methylase